MPIACVYGVLLPGGRAKGVILFTYVILLNLEAAKRPSLPHTPA